MAGCQVVPPSSETSTLPTRPPTSDAVPVTVTVSPLLTTELEVGVEMVVCGAVVSVEVPGAVSPDIIVVGRIPMSPNRFTVACCIRTSVSTAAPSCWSSRPQDHCTVPAPKTMAPLAALYIVIRWVASPSATDVP